MPFRRAFHFAGTEAPIRCDTRTGTNPSDQSGLQARVGASGITCDGCKTGSGVVHHKRCAPEALRVSAKWRVFAVLSETRALFRTCSKSASAASCTRTMTKEFTCTSDSPGASAADAPLPGPNSAQAPVTSTIVAIGAMIGFAVLLTVFIVILRLGGSTEPVVST